LQRAHSTSELRIHDKTGEARDRNGHKYGKNGHSDQQFKQRETSMVMHWAGAHYLGQQVWVGALAGRQDACPRDVNVIDEIMESDQLLDGLAVKATQLSIVWPDPAPHAAAEIVHFALANPESPDQFLKMPLAEAADTA